jgi:hypothetical protein
MPAHERADARAVDRRHGPQIGDDVPEPITEQGLDAPLELLGGTSPEKGFLRRNHQAAPSASL